MIAAWSPAAWVACFLIAIALAAAAAMAPRRLVLLNRGWLRLGELLGRVFNPIVLGLIYFGLLAPVAIAARLLGRDELRLKPRRASSYWIDRTPPGPSADSFKNQF